jgi:hypothetical protein
MSGVWRMHVRSEQDACPECAFITDRRRRAQQAEWETGSKTPQAALPSLTFEHAQQYIQRPELVLMVVMGNGSDVPVNASMDIGVCDGDRPWVRAWRMRTSARERYVPVGPLESSPCPGVLLALLLCLSSRGIGINHGGVLPGKNILISQAHSLAFISVLTL